MHAARRLAVVGATLAGCNQVFGLDPTSPIDAPPPPPPPVGFVQVDANEDFSDSVDVEMSAPLQVGDTLVACAYADGPDSVAVTDTQHNMFTQIVGPAMYGPGGNVYLFAAYATKAGSDTVTLAGTNGLDLILFVHEFVNVGAFQAGSSQHGTDQSTDGMTSGAIAAAPATMLFGCGISQESMAGTNFATLSTFDSNITEYRIVSQAGSDAATATSTGFPADWTMLGAVFR
ncbi:MAG TPA: hypothetical protein VMJ10_04475 [Kofleriaceae bacterium]|nr:hypothetical protein [Kofleriaceae bacterium]